PAPRPRPAEGPAAIWLTLLGPDDRAHSVVASGPFGPEILWLDAPVTRPHRLVVLAGPVPTAPGQIPRPSPFAQRPPTMPKRSPPSSRTRASPPAHRTSRRDSP